MLGLSVGRGVQGIDLIQRFPCALIDPHLRQMANSHLARDVGRRTATKPRSMLPRQTGNLADVNERCVIFLNKFHRVNASPPWVETGRWANTTRLVCCPLDTNHERGPHK